MKKYWKVFSIYLIVFCILIATTLMIDRSVVAFSLQRPVADRVCVIIDAGHGGIDGGATSCTGVLESQINLEIATRLNDLMHLLGIRTYMIRTDARSVHTQGETIATKKISDLKERVRIANSLDNAYMISIHQNFFADSRYHGAQVFYSNQVNSKALATELQNMLNMHLCPLGKRSIQKGEGIYLLEKIRCCGVMVECGFLSNPVEEARLRSKEYQQALCSVIAVTVHGFIKTT